MKESRWKESFRRNGIARRCSHPGRDQCDARYETARKLEPCAWPSATTNTRNPLEGRSRSQRPRWAGAASSIIRCVALATRSRLRLESATSPDERGRSRELTTQNSERRGAAYYNAAVATEIATGVTAARRTGNPATACRCNPIEEFLARYGAFRHELIIT